jgi:hypothetical protein
LLDSSQPVVQVRRCHHRHRRRHRRCCCHRCPAAYRAISDCHPEC